MKYILSLFVLLVAWTSIASSQSVSNYYTRFDMLMAPPSTFQNGLLGFANPANLGVLDNPDARLYWSTDGPKTWSFKDWGLFLASPGFGFGMYRQSLGDYRITDYNVALGFGSDAFSMGLSYNWHAGDADVFNRQRQVLVSGLWRPIRRFSLGVTGFFSTETSQSESVVELGLRPLGTPILTLFADALVKDYEVTRENWSAGAVIQPVPGVNIVGRYFGSESFTIGLALELGYGALGGQGHYNVQKNHVYNTYMLRSGGLRNSLFQQMAKNIAYVPFQVRGTVEYQKFVLFDDETVRFYDLLRDIHAAANDPRVATLALNLASMRIRPEHAWELREQLKYAQEKDKKVIVFIENAGMTGYHLASVADIVVMEPLASLILPGFILSRTYLEGTLEKLGIGFDEWRYYKYKTAYESYSRESLSEADKKQYQAYLDDWYDLVQNDVTRSRNLTPEEWDNIIDEKMLLGATAAQEAGLVDRLDRWSNMEDIIHDFHDGQLFKMPRGQIWDNAVAREEWGPQPKIALVYALGTTSMESGIRARWLERQLHQLAKDRRIKAVVFRVDSPGGSAMAADVVANALKKVAEAKPVIVSQGQVAGSGGYWISMYGDTIIAGPNTITGSIGVIGGWVWDKGFTEKLGMTADYVKRGKHADYEFGVTLPLLGLTIPARNLNDEELARIEKWVRELYDDFITQVSEGRNMSKAKVDSIAQGRFYSGYDGQDAGLVDKMGGLMTAFAIAKEKAGIGADEMYELVEIPKSYGLFDLLGRAPGVKTVENDPVIQYLRLLTEEHPTPLFMLPPGTYPSAQD